MLLKEIRWTQERMRNKRSLLLDLSLVCPRRFMKPLSPRLIGFFSRYCGTAILTLPPMSQEEFQAFEAAFIPGIRELSIIDRSLTEFPQGLHAFVDLEMFSLASSVTSLSLVLDGPGLKLLTQYGYAFWPKLQSFNFVRSPVSKVDLMFLERLPRDATLIYWDGLYSEDGMTTKVSSLCAVGEFIRRHTWL